MKNNAKQLKSLYGKVAIVGDGVNDAPALATAGIVKVVVVRTLPWKQLMLS